MNTKYKKLISWAGKSLLNWSMFWLALIGVVYAANTITTVTSQTISSGDSIWAGWYQSVNDKLINTYSKSEIDSKWYLIWHQDISGKANSSDVYSKTQVYTQTEINTLIDNLRTEINTPTWSTSSKPWTSCKDILNKWWSNGDWVYWIKTDSSAAYQVYCDMTTDWWGWTLIWQTNTRENSYSNWLVWTKNTNNCLDPWIETNIYCSIHDSRWLAVDYSSSIRFSNSTRTKWVKWSLPTGRTTSTLWNHSAWYTAVYNEASSNSELITVSSSWWSTSNCYQNKYWIMAINWHWWSYPAATLNWQWNTWWNDLCMAIEITWFSSSWWSYGWNWSDAPTSDTDWPNWSYNVTPKLSVWVK